jgi:hypothetical protein
MSAEHFKPVIDYILGHYGHMRPTFMYKDNVKFYGPGTAPIHILEVAVYDGAAVINLVSRFVMPGWYVY